MINFSSFRDITAPPKDAGCGKGEETKDFKCKIPESSHSAVFLSSFPSLHSGHLWSTVDVSCSGNSQIRADDKHFQQITVMK